MGRTWLVCLLLAGATVLAYGPVATFEFTNYDDSIFVYDNPRVTGGLSWQWIWWALSTSFFDFWHPVTWWSHMLDCELFGLRAGWHHLTNLGLHVANTLLLFGVLRRMTGAWKRSALVAALFALHPIHVESVAWISERKDVLSTFFFLLTVWAYAAYVKKSQVSSLKSQVPKQSPVSSLKSQVAGQSQVSRLKPSNSLKSSNRAGGGPDKSGRRELERLETEDLRLETGGSIQNHPPRSTLHAPRFTSSSFYYALALVCFALGLMSKAMVVTLPFVLLLLDYWPLRRNAEWRVQSAECRQTGTVENEEWGMQSAELGSEESAACGVQNAGCRGAGAPVHHFKFKIKNLKLKIFLRLLVEKVPFFALSAASCVITWVGMRTAGNLLSAEQAPWGLRLANVPVSYVRYLGKVIWPADLAVLYPVVSHWALWQVAGAIVVLLVISAVVVVRARAATYLVFGWLMFLGTLVPVIGIVANGLQSIADRYMYIPSIGLFVAVVWAAADWDRRHWERRRHRRRVAEKSAAPVGTPEHTVTAAAGTLGRAADKPAVTPALPVAALPVAVAAAVLAALTLCTRSQLQYWRNSTALWTRCLAVTHDNATAEYNFGVTLRTAGYTNEALVHFTEAARIKPDYEDVSNLGVAYAINGQLWDATNYFTQALRLKPDYAKAHEDLGAALFELGDFAGAITHCAEALRLGTNRVRSLTCMARAFSGQGKSEAAMRYYTEALRLKPDHVEALYCLGLERLRRGEFDAAAANLSEAARLKPGVADAHFQLAVALMGKGAPGEAIAQYHEALRLSPDSPAALNNLAWVLATHPDGQYRNGVEAVQLAGRACELTGYGQPIFIGTLAAAYAEAGEYEKAVETGEQACKLAASLGQTNLVEKNRELVGRYRNREAYREGAANK